MAKLIQQPHVIVDATLQINESEMRALQALFCYGVQNLLDTFYENLGKAYLEKHEAGLRQLAAGVDRDIPGILKRIDAARAEFLKGGAA